MFSSTQIIETRKIFESVVKKYNLFPQEFLDKYLEKISTAPASTMKKLHNAFEGGLLDHMMNVAKYAKGINSILEPEMKQDYTSLLKVCFLSEIGKMDLYQANPSEWHRNNLGKMYEFNEDLVSMSVGERSVYIALSNNISLNPMECQAIYNYDKAADDKQSTWHTETLGVILRQATMLAIIEEKGKYERAVETAK